MPSNAEKGALKWIMDFLSESGWKKESDSTEYFTCISVCILQDSLFNSKHFKLAEYDNKEDETFKLNISRLSFYCSL